MRDEPDGGARARLLDMTRQVPGGERLARALALSSLVRGLAWEGVRRKHPGESEAHLAVRFVERLYGGEIAARFSRATLREAAPR